MLEKHITNDNFDLLKTQSEKGDKGKKKTKRTNNIY